MYKGERFENVITHAIELLEWRKSLEDDVLREETIEKVLEDLQYAINQELLKEELENEASEERNEDYLESKLMQEENEKWEDVFVLSE